MPATPAPLTKYLTHLMVGMSGGYNHNDLLIITDNMPGLNHMCSYIGCV